MRNSKSIPGWRSLASRYCCIMGVDMSRMVAVARRPAALAELEHGDAIAGGVVDDLGHVVADQEQSPAAGALQVLVAQGVGDVVRVEAGPLVGDGDLEAVGV